MKANAFTTVPVILYRVWGPDEVPVLDLLPNHPVFVVWSPIHRRHIMSISSTEARYDSFVEAYHFRPDPSLEIVEERPEGAKYYLDQIRSHQGVA